MRTSTDAPTTTPSVEPDPPSPPGADRRGGAAPGPIPVPLSVTAGRPWQRLGAGGGRRHHGPDRPGTAPGCTSTPSRCDPRPDCRSPDAAPVRRGPGFRRAGSWGPVARLASAEALSAESASTEAPSPESASAEAASPEFVAPGAERRPEQQEAEPAPAPSTAEPARPPVRAEPRPHRPSRSRDRRPNRRPRAPAVHPRAPGGLLPAGRRGRRGRARAGRAAPGRPVATLGEARLAVATVVARGPELAMPPAAARGPAGRRSSWPSCSCCCRWPTSRSSTRPAGPAWRSARWPRCWPGRCCAGSACRCRRPPRSGPAGGRPARGRPARRHLGRAPAAVWLMIAACVRRAAVGPGRGGRRADRGGDRAAGRRGPARQLAAHLVLGRILRVAGPAAASGSARAGRAAAAWRRSAVGSGPLAGAAGPVLGDRGHRDRRAGRPASWSGWPGAAADWLRPVLTAAVLLLLAALVPGPSRATAALLVAPVLAVAVGLLLDQVGERSAGPGRRRDSACWRCWALVADRHAVRAREPVARAGRRERPDLLAEHRTGARHPGPGRRSRPGRVARRRLPGRPAARSGRSAGAR